MKNLLIGKSFSYEIVDFTLLWQSNTYHLGGGRSIQLSYEDLYEKLLISNCHNCQDRESHYH